MFCSGASLWYSYAIKSNTAVVNFYTDYSLSGRGFFVNWRAVDPRQCNSTVILNKTDDVMTTSSLNFPHGYLNDMTCHTVIKTPPGTRVYLVFTQFQLNVLPGNCADHVILLLDSDSNYGQLLCATNSSNITKLRFLSINNYTAVIFSTDAFYNGIGFNATYTVGMYYDR